MPPRVALSAPARTSSFVPIRPRGGNVGEIPRQAAEVKAAIMRAWRIRFWSAEDRFNLVVVGRLSRGKTSLMNAIMGTDRLPTGMVPLGFDTK